MPRLLKIESLKTHPRQSDFFADVSESELQALASDMQAHGLREPIEILPDGTIISGHQRVRAAKLIGWTEINANVLAELAAKGADAIVEALILANLHRRTLSCIEMAKIFRETKRQELARGGKCASGTDLRDRVAMRLGFGRGGKQLEDDERLLDLPPQIQQAVASRAVTKSLAMRIVRAPPEKQREIAEGLAGGREDIALIRRLLAGAPPSKTSASTRIVRKQLLALIHLLDTTDVMAQGRDKFPLMKMLKLAIGKLQRLYRQCDPLPEDGTDEIDLSAWPNLGIRNSTETG